MPSENSHGEHRSGRDRTGGEPETEPPASESSPAESAGEPEAEADPVKLDEGIAVGASEIVSDDACAALTEPACGSDFSVGDDGEDVEEDADGEAAEEDGDKPDLPFDSTVEAILFASREPLKAGRIAKAVGKSVRQSLVREAIRRLNLHYLETGRAFEIAEIAERFQFMSRPEFAHHIRSLYPKRGTDDREKALRLTPATLDTLTIIAYKQPVTRGEVERIRGVGCGPVLRALIERGTVRVVGKRADLVGQPLTYGTTDAFLVEFGLGSLDELPLRNEFLNFAPLDAVLGETAMPEAAAAAPSPESEG